jgi:hypothetical protein
MKRFKVEIVGVIVCLLLAELLVRTAVPRADIEKGLWYSEDVAPKLALLQAQGKKVKVLVLGDSAVNDAFNPIVFDRAYKELTGKSTYSFNAAIAGAYTSIVSFYSRTVYPRYLKPDAIIYPITLMDLSRPGNASQPEAFQISLMENALAKRNSSLLGKIDFWLLENSLLYRSRAFFRRYIANPTSSFFNDPKIDKRGFKAFTTRLSKLTPDQLKKVRADAANRSIKKLNPGMIRQLELIIKNAKDRNIKFYLVADPLNPHMIDFLPNGIKDYENFVATLKSVANKYDVPLWTIDMKTWDQHITDADYRDYGHMNRYGAEKFTRMIAEWYAAVSKSQ